jgi:ABC-type phosphate transport system substrate-binding protein
VDDGDYVGDSGYNSTGNVNKVVNFDATADANARLAYGPQGVGSGTCSPGEGATVGTGNQTGTHSDQPCILNPTIVLRAGLSPVLRPNGSGAGGAAGEADGAFSSSNEINYVRASSPQGSTLSSAGVQWDDVQIGTDPLAMLTEKTTNAVPLSVQQLNAIYSCTDTKWTQVGGTSTDTIIPIIPQLGSGTRSTFLKDISLSAPGACVVTGEENDPFAIDAQTSPADAIEPFSGGRLNLYQGISGTGANIGAGAGYFADPSCPVESTASACQNDFLAPKVKLVTTGNPSDGNQVFDSSRPLYIYFRDAAINSTTPFQSGSSLNYVRTLFYNPCPAGTSGCVTIGGVKYGPGGQPFYATSSAATLISAAGINPSYVINIPGA